MPLAINKVPWLLHVIHPQDSHYPRGRPQEVGAPSFNQNKNQAIPTYLTVKKQIIHRSRGLMCIKQVQIMTQDVDSNPTFTLVPSFE